MPGTPELLFPPMQIIHSSKGSFRRFFFNPPSHAECLLLVKTRIFVRSRTSPHENVIAAGRVQHAAGSRVMHTAQRCTVIVSAHHDAASSNMTSPAEDVTEIQEDASGSNAAEAHPDKVVDRPAAQRLLSAQLRIQQKLAGSSGQRVYSLAATQVLAP